MIYGVGNLSVAARRRRQQINVAGGAMGRPPVGPLVLFPLALLGPMRSATDVLFEIAESSCTLMLFEPARRGQTLGRWNVDPVYIALLWTGYSCIPVLRSARQALVRKAR
jgi:hypothetical protein